MNNDPIEWSLSGAIEGPFGVTGKMQPVTLVIPIPLYVGHRTALRMAGCW